MNHIQSPSIENTMNTTKSQNVFVGIAGIVGGVSLVIVTMIAILSPHSLSVAPWIVGGLSAMGVALGYFSSNKD